MFALRSSRPHQRYATYAAICLAAAYLPALVLLGSNWYLTWLAASGLVTFAFYGWDKRQARTDGQRVPEVVLHTMALLGGFIGGWLGRAVFRHKTRRLSFALILTLATLLHAAFLLWLFA